MNKNPVETYAHEHFPHGSITNLAKAAEVSYGTVHKTIQGLYSAIPEKLAAYMAENSDYNEEQWQAWYSLWEKKELEILKNDISQGKLEAVALYVAPEEIAKRYGNFSEWRESLSYSQVDFCKTFLLHQGIINKYELGQMKNLPESLISRLRFLGLSDEYINALNELPTKGN